MKYEPSLDGVRAIAILAVLAYHCFPESLPGGFTGVDVFFVLSGYLITSVILCDVREGTFSMREFYLRRIQRLLPNAVAMVLATVTLSFVLVGPLHAAKTARHALWALFNLSNVFVWRNLGGYWGDSDEFAVLLHTWSLAVEEQFYLLFPAMLLFLSRRRGSRIAPFVGLLAAVSLSLAVGLTPAHPDASFYLLPTRAWEPLLGAVLAALRLPADRREAERPLVTGRAAEAAGWAGLAGIFAGFALVSGDLPFPGLAALAPTVGTALLLVSVADGRTRVARLLSLPALTLIGSMSYSIYLWHWPGLVLGRLAAGLEGFPRRSAELVGAAIGLLIAAVAYVAIEQPLRRRGAGRRRRLLVLAGGFTACVAASAFLAFRPAPDNGRGLFDPPGFQVLLFDATRGGSHDEIRGRPQYADLRMPPAEPRPADTWRTGGIVHAWGGGTPRVVVVGSSHALMYGRVIDDACRRLRVPVAFFAADGTSPIFGRTRRHTSFRSLQEEREFEAARARWLREWRPDVVFVIDRWDEHPPEEFARNLDPFVRGLEDVARHVVLVAQVPVLRVGSGVNLREFVSRSFAKRGVLPSIPADAGEPVRQRAVRTMEALARGRDGVRVLRPDEAFYAPDGTVRYSRGRSFLYADRDHLTDEGANEVKDLFAAAIASGCDVEPGVEPDAATAGTEPTSSR